MTAYIIIMVLLFITIIAFAQRNSDYCYDFPATEPAPGQYRFFSEKSGVTIYSSWISTSGTTLAVNFKLINNNQYPVVVTWSGPRWYSKGLYLASSNHPVEVVLDNPTHTDLLASHNGKDNHDYQPGVNAAEISQSSPNYLYYDAPRGSWRPGQLTVKLTNFQVLPQAANCS